jgi:hypothetical protein
MAYSPTRAQAMNLKTANRGTGEWTSDKNFAVSSFVFASLTFAENGLFS